MNQIPPNLNNTRDCQKGGIGPDRRGPVLIYMAKVASSLKDHGPTAVGSDLRWFKVAETGLIRTNYWASDALNANCGRYEFTIPWDIRNGYYLIRAEFVSLKNAKQVGGAEFYMSCYQVAVSGSTSKARPKTYKIPGKDIYNPR